MHKTKGGKWTSKSARGGGKCYTFNCGWDEEGLDVHRALMIFYYSIQKHDAFPEMVKKCGEWWETNKSRGRSTLEKKRSRECMMSETKAPTFEEFENYAGV